MLTPDWVEAWGAFDFTLVDVAPGTYELFIGEFSARDGSPMGITQTITVTG